MKSLLVLFLTVITAQTSFAAAASSQSCYTPGASLATHYWAQVSTKTVTVMHGTVSPLTLKFVGILPVGNVSNNESVVHIYNQADAAGRVSVNGMTAKVVLSTLTGKILKVELFSGGIQSAAPMQTLTECKDSI